MFPDIGIGISIFLHCCNILCTAIGGVALVRIPTNSPLSHTCMSWVWENIIVHSILIINQLQHIQKRNKRNTLAELDENNQPSGCSIVVAQRPRLPSLALVNEGIPENTHYTCRHKKLQPSTKQDKNDG